VSTNLLKPNWSKNFRYQAKNVLPFENGVLAFENRVFAFEKGVLAFENGDATCYEQPVLVLLEQLVASLLPSSTL
jgi:hypothetical protein